MSERVTLCEAVADCDKLEARFEDDVLVFYSGNYSFALSPAAIPTLRRMLGVDAATVLEEMKTQRDYYISESTRYRCIATNLANDNQRLDLERDERARILNDSLLMAEGFKRDRDALQAQVAKANDLFNSITSLAVEGPEIQAMYVKVDLLKAILDEAMQGYNATKPDAGRLLPPTALTTTGLCPPSTEVK